MLFLLVISHIAHCSEQIGVLAIQLLSYNLVSLWKEHARITVASYIHRNRSIVVLRQEIW